jgi:hypothetical protein
VPKYLPKADGSIDAGGPKNLSCGGLEKKMGIHGSSTCVMNFEDSKGFLIGAENKGLNQVGVVVARGSPRERVYRIGYMHVRHCLKKPGLDVYFHEHCSNWDSLARYDPVHVPMMAQ